MDQPTTLKIAIKGNTEDVKRAALAAQSRIDRNTRGFVKSAYEFGDGSDFVKKINAAVRSGVYNYSECEDGTAEYTTEQESYACIYEEDITGIAKAIAEVAPDVEAHISAVITITYSEGYDLCVEVDYVDGEMSVNISEEPYEDWDDDEDEDEDYE